MFQDDDGIVKFYIDGVLSYTSETFDYGNTYLTGAIGWTSSGGGWPMPIISGKGSLSNGNSENISGNIQQAIRKVHHTSLVHATKEKSFMVAFNNMNSSTPDWEGPINNDGRGAWNDFDLQYGSGWDFTRSATGSYTLQFFAPIMQGTDEYSVFIDVTVSGPYIGNFNRPGSTPSSPNPEFLIRCYDTSGNLADPGSLSLKLTMRGPVISNSYMGY